MSKTRTALVICMWISCLTPGIEASGYTPAAPEKKPRRAASLQFELTGLAVLGALGLLQSSTSKKKPTRED